MADAGHAVSLLHGDLSPEERDTVIDEFREGVTKVLITTNVLARGIDIPQVTDFFVLFYFVLFVCLFVYLFLSRNLFLLHFLCYLFYCYIFFLTREN